MFMSSFPCFLLDDSLLSNVLHRARSVRKGDLLIAGLAVLAKVLKEEGGLYSTGETSLY